MVNQAPIPDWNKTFPNLNEKYSDLLQSHSSLCGEIEQLKADKEALIEQRDKAYSEKDAALLQNSEMRDLLISVNQAYTLTFAGQRGSMEAMFKTIDKYLKEQQTEKRIDDPILKKIDDGIQSIKDMSTIRNDRCPKCNQPVDNVIHFCPKPG